MPSARIWLYIALILIFLGFAWYVSARPMDFRVYYYGAEGVFDGTRPVYGETSGLGWPMHYRYPPLFLLLAFPFTLLPIPWAAAIWALLKIAALTLVVRALWSRLGKPMSPKAWLIPLLLAGTYVVEDLRYGNAQSFIFALTAAGLLFATASPRWAGAALALGIIVKVWPLYFVPYLAVRREWKTVAWTLALTVVFALAPAAYFGLGTNLDLLEQWAAQEFSTQAGAAEIWFPSQSLRGVMMRYFTAVDYSQLPDPNYQQIHVASLQASTVRTLWIILAAAAYCGVLLISSRPARIFGVTEGLVFSTLILLQPFSQKYTLVVLLWPAMVAGRLENNRWKGLLYSAVVVALAQPLIQGAAAQRLLQVMGMDFLATALLTVFLVASITVRDEARRYYSPNTRIP